MLNRHYHTAEVTQYVLILKYLGADLVNTVLQLKDHIKEIVKDYYEGELETKKDAVAFC